MADLKKFVAEELAGEVLKLDWVFGTLSRPLLDTPLSAIADAIVSGFFEGDGSNHDNDWGASVELQVGCMTAICAASIYAQLRRGHTYQHMMKSVKSWWLTATQQQTLCNMVMMVITPMLRRLQCLRESMCVSTGRGPASRIPARHALSRPAA